MTRSRKIIFVFAMLMLAAMPLAVAQGTYTQIDVPGAFYTFANGIDTTGDVVGYYGDTSGNEYGFFLSGGTFTFITYPGSTRTDLYGINDNGQIVGQTDFGGILYDLQTQAFTLINDPHADQTYPYAINNAGAVVGLVTHNGGLRNGFELLGSTYRLISPEPTLSSFTLGIAQSGTIAGYVLLNSQIRNFLFRPGKYAFITIPSAPGATLTGISSTGNALIGNYNPSSGVTAGFVYQNKVLTTLQFPGSNLTGTNGANAGGEVVGTFYDTNFTAHGFTWTPPAPTGKK